MDNEAPVSTSPDSNNMALLIWILSIFFTFIPSLIFYLVKKDDPYVQDQSKEALNWSITVLAAWIALWIISFVMGMLLALTGLFAAIAIWSGLMGLVFLAVGILHLVFCIMGAIACSNGKAYRCPFALRLIK